MVRIGEQFDCQLSFDRRHLSREPEGKNLPGSWLHELKGPLKGHWAVSVSDNWRVTFRFEDGAAVDVDYLDYH